MLSVARRLLAPALIAGAAVFFLSTPARTSAQSYSSGQPVWPAFEGWERNADGSFNMVFGYMNDNWQEELDVPIGPENNITPGSADQGQPTHFMPRRNRFVFRVKVPKDFGTREMIWTLASQAKPQKAFASLRPDLLIENIDIMSETGSLGAGTSTPQIRANIAPVIAIDGVKTRTVKVGQAVELVATMTDDGVPRARGALGGAVRARAMMQPPFRPTPAKNNGLHISWYVYRGAGPVTFDPPSIKAWEDTRTGANSPWAPYWTPPAVPADNKYSVRATFLEPGTYVICARGDDGGLTADDFVTITATK